MRFVKRLVLGLVLLAVLMALFQGSSKVEVEPNSVLLVELQGNYVEGPEPPLLMRMFWKVEKPMASVLSDLAKAERDDRIDVVIIRIRELQIGWAKVQEIRDSITRLNLAGRKTVAYLETETFGSNQEFYLATAANRVVLAPGTRAPLVGLAAEFFFLGGLWEKLGIELEVERIGKYKSAAESISGKSMSEPSREMADAMLESINNRFIGGMAKGRGLSEAQIRAAVDEAPVKAARLQELGLIDEVLFFDELLARYEGQPSIKAEVYAGVDPEDVGFEPVARFAVIYGSGGVTRKPPSSTRSGPVLNAQVVSDALNEVANDPEIDAILFRVDSPGGSPLASDIVWRAVERARMKKPVVASLSDVAASGGYYVVCGADRIVAEPATLTGSIGVFAIRPVLSGLLTKLGIGTDSIVMAEHAGVLLSTKNLTLEGRERFRADIRETYNQFIARVAQGRNMSLEAVDEVGQGRVWTGDQALEIGLIDALGGLREAALQAKELVGLEPDDDVALLPYPQPKPLAEQLGDVLGGSQLGVEVWMPSSLRKLESLLSLVPEGAPAVLPPYWVEIH
jgi:protease-4